jgi:hypothetical protein
MNLKIEWTGFTGLKTGLTGLEPISSLRFNPVNPDNFVWNKIGRPQAARQGARQGWRASKILLIL